MTTKDLDAILDKLTSAREHKKQIAIAKAQKELETIQRETDAYWDGMCDFCNAVKQLLPTGGEGDGNA